GRFHAASLRRTAGSRRPPEVARTEARVQRLAARESMDARRSAGARAQASYRTGAVERSGRRRSGRNARSLDARQGAGSDGLGHRYQRNLWTDRKEVAPPTWTSTRRLQQRPASTGPSLA